MLDMNEIHEEIKKLEECKCTTQDVCKKLAILYIIRDHYKGETTEKREAPSAAMMSSVGSPMMTMSK